VTCKSLLALAASLVCSTFLLAQPPASNTLDKDADGTYRHPASKSAVKPPKDWEIVDTKGGGTNQPHLSLRKTFGGLDVLITWTRLQDVKFDEAVELELNQLAQTYGKDKVSKKEPITVDNKSVSVIEVADGPDRNGKQVGTVYLLDAGPDARERWKVKIRALMNKSGQAEAQKAVSQLLQQFQW
jgi:hypothetical protein